MTGNSVGGSPAETLVGGGIYTRDPITFRSSIVRGNSPDQCDGCSAPSSSAARAVTRIVAPGHVSRHQGDSSLARLRIGRDG